MYQVAMDVTSIILFVFVAVVPLIKGRPECPGKCPEQYLVSPTCGSDRNIYYHECEIQEKNCREGTDIAVIPWPKCKKMCQRNKCLTYWDHEMCREDGKWSGVNKCWFVSLQCSVEIPLKEAPESVCRIGTADEKWW